ncbi:helix-turn-helix domain-containing protein [Bradyrhizobium sp. 18BD]
MDNSKEISEREQEQYAHQRAMSIAQFCERYGLCRTKAYDELKAGHLRARKIGTRTIIAVDDAEDWLRRLPVLGGSK